MIEISLNNIKKSFGFKYILDGLSLEIKTGDHVAIIGENGCGKTTILNIICGIENIDSGNLAIRKGAVIGYLDQQPENKYANETVHNILYNSFSEIAIYGEKLKKYEVKIQENPNDMKIINKYLNIQEHFLAMGGYEINAFMDKVTHGLYIDHLLDHNFDTLSGGEQKRVVLASLILMKPNILLLDEPTNHLDIQTMEWLEEYLNKYNGTIVMVSHDRYFLDKVTNKTILIENGKGIVFHGNYSKYLKENEERIERELREYRDQQKLIIELKKKIKQLEEFGRLAYPQGESFYRRAENIRKRLARIEIKNKPLEKKELPMNFGINERTGRDVLNIHNYQLSIDNRVLIKNICLRVIYQDKICIIGDNGCGKTTLIKRIIEHSTNEIKVGSNVKIGYIPQQIFFEENITILDYARKYYVGDESHLRSSLNKFSFYKESVFKKISKLSGGEKVRLKLFSLLQEKCNFIILDEPTNHLDIFTRENLEDALNDYEGTLLFASHDRYFINKLANKIFYISNNKIKEFNGNYDYFMEHK